MTTGSSCLRRWLGPLAAVALATGQAAAANDWGIEQLMHSLAAVQSSQATFVELKHVALLTTPLQSRGRLVYVAPGKLEKHTLSPREESLVLQGDELTVESGGRKRRLQLQDQPVVRAFVESIRSTLAGDLATLRSFYAIQLEGSERRWRLILKPGDRQVQEIVSEIRIVGSRDAITHIEFLETGGDRTVMTITRDGA